MPAAAPHPDLPRRSACATAGRRDRPAPVWRARYSEVKQLGIRDEEPAAVRPWARRACAAVLLYAAAAPATASIVNIEGQRGAPEEGFSGRYHLSVSGASGNTDKAAVTAGARLESLRGTVTNLAILQYAYGESNDVRDTNRAFGHLRHTVQRWERVAPEAYVQAERNEFTRLSFRGLVGGGLRLNLHDSPNLRTYLGIGAFLARETWDGREGVTDSGAHYFRRASSYLSVNGSLNEYTRLYNTLYYQPALDRPSDFRLLDEAGLIVRLTESIDLKVAVLVAHQSRPPQTVENTDVNFNTGIEYRFMVR